MSTSTNTQCIITKKEQDFNDKFIPMMNNTIYSDNKIRKIYAEQMLNFLTINNYIKNDNINFTCITQYSENFKTNVNYIILTNEENATDTFSYNYMINHPNNYTSESIIRTILFRSEIYLELV
jgi:hypothetical protein